MQMQSSRNSREQAKAKAVSIWKIGVCFAFAFLSTLLGSAQSTPTSGQPAQSQSTPSQATPSQPLPSQPVLSQPVSPIASPSGPKSPPPQTAAPALPADKPLDAKGLKQKQLADDTAKLAVLAGELKAEIDKSSKDTLSMRVIKKAAEVEKLAHKVRDEMKATL